MPMSEKRNQLGSGALWSLLDNAAQQGISFLVFLVLARLIAPQELGLIAIAHVVITFARQTLFNAIAQPVARAKLPSDALYSSAFIVCMLAGLLMSGLMLAGGAVFSRFHPQSELPAVLAWMSLAVLATGAATVFETRLIRQMKFKPLAIRSIVSVIAGGAVGIGLAYRGLGVMALVAQQLVSSCIALVLLVAQAHWLPRITWRDAAYRELLPDVSRVGLSGLFSFLASQGDTVLVSAVMGSYATGIYSFAKRLTSAIYLLIGSSLLKLAIPAFAEAGESPAARRDAYIRLTGITIFLMAPLLAGLSFLAKPMILVFFGEVWAPAAPIVALLSVLYLLFAINQINDFLLFAVGARSVPVQRGLIQTVLALLFGWLLSRYGLTWTATGFVLASALVWPWVQKVTNGHMELSVMGMAHALKGPVLATSAMLLFLALILGGVSSSALTLTGLIVAGAVVFLSSYMLVVRMSPSSHNALKDLLRLRRPAPL
jgi:O-antigen/teichoic acid export membrane protein